MKKTLAPALLLVVGLTACSAPATTDTATISVTNCGEQVQFPSPAQRLFVNDGNMVSMALALGAQDSVAAVSSVQRDSETLRRHYGDAVDALNSVAPEYPSRETVLAQNPDVMVAGWNYGYSEEKNLTPASLEQDGIAPYTLTESCRQRDGEQARGVVAPWDALRTDLTNLGTITGRTEDATEVVDDLDTRLDALSAAPKAERPPVIFLFDSASDTVFSSGKFGAPQAIIDAAGGVNALADLDDTWTAVSWERVAAANPDAFLFVDYPPQSFQEKVALLDARPGISQIPAVVDRRFLNLPYALWTSGPLNIDAAEQVRKQLETWGLVPPSDVTATFDDSVGVDGQ
ncbi:putative iron compound ABC transporter, substrate-binding protein [Rhodococcoides trifolii]|uniref:Iron compound ABC transporter, substrate-binding protein n=1 Tax=Rhodococcoides trifolii TaxID=908250 RepID=A0A917FPG0_9NOCA|nr:ABC transporter substrate-binding protein [Rhodococcus trifolii]GGF97484.1 putative iron compound ABC transporter, substrate-binding protein [Rhodococcus trifolii]